MASVEDMARAKRQPKGDFTDEQRDLARKWIELLHTQCGSLKEMERRTGPAWQTFQKILGGQNPGLPTVRAVAEYYGVGTEEIVSRAPLPDEQPNETAVAWRQKLLRLRDEHPELEWSAATLGAAAGIAYGYGWTDAKVVEWVQDLEAQLRVLRDKYGGEKPKR